MKYFKVLIFVLVLTPVSVFATIVGDSNISEYGDLDSGVSNDVANLEAGFQTVIVDENEGYTIFGFLITNISDLTVTHEENVYESGIVAMDLDVGIHTFPAETTVLNVSTQPAPAPKWSMGAAMLGLLTVSRRNKAKS